MWNAYVTKEYVETIKGYAKEYSGKLFKPIDTRMKNEELITMLAYLAFIERKDQTKPGEYLNDDEFDVKGFIQSLSSI